MKSFVFTLFALLGLLAAAICIVFSTQSQEILNSKLLAAASILVSIILIRNHKGIPIKDHF